MSGFEDSAGSPAHYLGHRDRLRGRFRDKGADTLADYELLELALFRALPRRDTKPVAKALLARFGTLADVLSAPPERLKEIDGVGEQAVTDLKLFRAIAERMGQDSVRKRPILSSWNALLDYCRTAMAYEEREQFRILFLDKKNALIADEVQQTGTFKIFYPVVIKGVFYIEKNLPYSFPHFNALHPAFWP